MKKWYIKGLWNVRWLFVLGIIWVLIQRHSLAQTDLQPNSEQKLSQTLEQRSDPEADAEVEVQWEPIPQAKAYELEFQPVDPPGETKVFETTEPRFKGQLVPGTYGFRIRSIDLQNDKGEWSSPVTLVARAEEVTLRSPILDKIIEAKGNTEVVQLSWDALPEAKGYLLRIWSEVEGKVKTFKTKKVNVSLKLLASRRYFWEIYPIDKRGVRHERSSPPESFVIYGRRVPPPKLVLLSPKDPQKVEWKTVKSISYSLSFYRRDLLAEDWTRVNFQEGLDQGSWALPLPLFPGQYKIEVIGKAPMRFASEIGELEFFIKPKLEEVKALSLYQPSTL